MIISLKKVHKEKCWCVILLKEKDQDVCGNIQIINNDYKKYTEMKPYYFEVIKRK